MGDFYVKNGSLSEVVEGLVVFVDIWFMPLFFFIAGAAAFFALGRRSSREFAAERAKRLLVPFVFGLLVIVPPQIFCVYLQKPGNPASYVSFWKYQFSVPPFTQITAGKVGDALITAFTWESGHLWFILYLFIFSLLTLPLLKSIRSGRLRAPSERLARFCERRSWGIYLFATPLMIAYVFMINLDDDLSRLFLVIPFIFGFLIYSNPAFGRALDKLNRWPLLIAVVTTLILAAALLITESEMTGASVFLWGPWGGLAAWLWLMSFIGIARRSLNFSNRTLEYANEGSYPFYILHQTVIVALALGIVELSAPIIVKYLLLTTASLLLSLAIYDLLIRRWRTTRFLFGMRPAVGNEASGRHGV